jgi:hypothetical protein
MDVEKLIAELNTEIEKIKGTIACLERLRGSSSAATNGSRRGRKSMGAQERQQVSARMKRHWASRRKTQR